MKYVLLLVLVLVSFGASSKIKVGEKGLIQSELNGQICRAYGVNYFDVFHLLLQNSKNMDYQRGFSELHAFAIPFVRFSAMSYWPKDFLLYFENKEEYFRRLDLIFSEAEKNNIGLIPSFFFNRAMIPDLMDEPLKAWSNPKSKTILFMRQYLKDFFSRYSSSRALWAVEFSNEINLYTNLPNAPKFRPKIDLSKGTRIERTQDDDLGLIDLQVALVLFEKEIRKYNKSIPVSSGNGHPRRYSYHNMKYNSWNLDSSLQTEYMLKVSHPDGVGLVSVHLYPHHRQKLGHIVKSKELSYQAILTRVQKVALENNKAVFIGEFGVTADTEFFYKEVDEFLELMNAIYNSRVSLAALWVYRFDFQKNSFDVREKSPREYQLRTLLEFNNKLRKNDELCIF